MLGEACASSRTWCSSADADRRWRPIGAHDDRAGVRDGASVRSAGDALPGPVVASAASSTAGARLGADGFGFAFPRRRTARCRRWARCVIEDDVEIGANTTVDRGSIGDTVIGARHQDRQPGAHRPQLPHRRARVWSSRRWASRGAPRSGDGRGARGAGGHGRPHHHRRGRAGGRAGRRDCRRAAGRDGFAATRRARTGRRCARRRRSSGCQS